MLRYRVLLVDTETFHKRPVQKVCESAALASKWAKARLKKASKHSYVVVYRVTEIRGGHHQEERL
jgi:hypothetical protein